MEKKSNRESKVELNATKKERAVCTLQVRPDAEDKAELLVHFSYLDGTFYAAMKRAKLEGFAHTFASGFYYTGALPDESPECGETSDWIWMPVETKADERFLFSVKPWEESELLPAQQKKIAETLKKEFGQFRKEMLHEQDGV